MDSATIRSPEASPEWVPRVQFASLFGLVRHITIGGFAGLVAGIVVGGLGSRLFMRIAGAAAGSDAAGRITEAGFRVGELTVGGSIALAVFIGIAAGMAGAVFYLALRPWLWMLGRWRGVGFGVVLFGLTSASSDVMNPDNPDFLILGNGILLVGLIVALYVAFGVAVDGAFGFLDRRIPGEEQGWKNIGVVYAGFAALGLVFAVPFALSVLFVGEGFCGCEPPVAASWSFVFVLVSSAALWITALVPRTPIAVRTLIGVAGYLGLAGVLFFGLVRAISDAIEIIG